MSVFAGSFAVTDRQSHEHRSMVLQMSHSCSNSSHDTQRTLKHRDSSSGTSGTNYSCIIANLPITLDAYCS